MQNPSADIALTEWTWKTDAMRQMACDVCDLAIRSGLGTFTAMDLPRHGEDAHGGSGIAGTVFKQLSDAGIIAPVGGFLDGEFQQKYVRNGGGNRIGVWRLANMPMAAALLRAHGRKDEKQQEFGI